MKAAQANAPACITLLWRANASLNVRDKKGMTAMHYAAQARSGDDVARSRSNLF
jgi:ankyrin repeat protein